VIVATHNNRLAIACISFGLVALAGCAAGSGTLDPLGSVSPVIAPAIAVTGQVYGGQQPISSASIMLWKVNTDGTAATALLNAPVTTRTDGTGGFTLTGFITNFITICAANPQVYVTAVGGNPGAGSNSSLALMAAIGNCSNLTSSTHISINEATTVAAVWALQQFFGVSEGAAPNVATGVPGENIVTAGTTQSNAGMVNAFLTANQLVNYTTGAVTANSSAAIEADKLYSIANVLAACVNSNGTGDCPSLFSAVTPAGGIFPGDTIQAALYIAQNPSYNTATVYALQSSTPPFPSALTSAPFDWSLAIAYSGTGFNLPNYLASDASGNIWVTNSASGSSSLTRISPGGAIASYLTGSSTFRGPQSVAIDTGGSVWITANSSASNTGNRLVQFNPNTSTAFSYSLASVGTCYPYYAAIDGSNDVFFPCNSLGTPSLYELPASSIGSATPTFTSVGSLNGATETYGMAIDSHTNIWASETQTYQGMTEFTAGTTGSPTAINNFGLGTGPYGVAIDNGNNAWAVNSGFLEEFAISSKTAASPTYTTSNYTGGGLTSGSGLAIDGNNNIWIANRNLSTISGTSYLSLSEFNSAGTALTPSNTTTQPGGLSVAPIANGVNVTDAQPRGLTLDPSGNVWLAGCGLSSSCSSGTNSFVTEFVGVAVPPYLPLSSAVAANKLGCCTFTPAAPANTTPAATAGYVGLQSSTTAGNLAFTQNSGQFYFLVTRTGGFTGAISVAYATQNGTAISGTDYTATSGTLNWASGDSSTRTIGPISWLDTTPNAGTKTFSINLACGACTGYSPYQSETVSVTAANTAPTSVAAFNKYVNTGTEQMYLGLPIDEYGGNGGLNGAQYVEQTIQPGSAPTGLTNFSDAYFYATTATVNSTANTPVIVFTAPSNGATSSPGVGTNDVRTEMREYYLGAGAVGNNDWTTAIGGTLTATLAVNSTSVDTTEATIGQIHGQNEPYALLEYQPTCSFNSNIYTGCVVLAYQVTNTTSSSSASNLLAYGIPTCSVSSLSSCTFFTYKLALVPNGGTPLLQASVSNIYGTGTIYGSAGVSVDSSWIGTAAADGLYFKFGAYSGAPNTGNPAGDQTQVTFAFPTSATGVTGDCGASATVPFCISHP
jgi:hypothetical protein